MKKFIVTTTIQSPTKATLKFAEMNDWKLIVVGDLKTPHKDYYDLEVQNKLIYLPPFYQNVLYPTLSKIIGWNTIQRRNIGFIYAYEQGADIVASVDDDNIPYDNWGKNVHVGKEGLVDVWENFNANVFDPLQLTNHNNLWHRGYPLQYLNLKNDIKYLGKFSRKILFQTNLWNGDPDIDAICRIMYNPKDLEMHIDAPFTTTNYVPFNSQNTFIAREALPYYMVLPFVGRVDDIWGGYIAQYLLNTRPLFMHTTVYQERNEQSLEKNLKDEVYGYINTSRLLDNIKSYNEYLPVETFMAFEEYKLTYGINNIS